MKILGIDPGVNGGLAVIDTEAQSILVVARMPTIEIDGKNRPDVCEIRELFGGIAIDRAVLERALTRPGESGANGLSIGCNWGMILSWILLERYPYRAVAPTVWTRAIHGKDGYKGKQTTIDWCSTMFPGTNLTGIEHRKAKPHDGICDAIAIAYYGSKIA